jgi:lipopolysaccharide transport system ATP-binding protein
LLLDEVLAVGDAAFQSKCLERVEALRRRGMTIVFVSHDMAAIERLCNRVYFLQQGRIRSVGDPQTVIRHYYDTVVLNHERVDATGSAATLAAANAAQAAEILCVSFRDSAGHETDTCATGEQVIARVDYRLTAAVQNPVFELLLLSPDGRLQCQLTTARSDGGPGLPATGAVEIVCDELGLAPGVYLVDAAIVRRGALSAYDRRARIATLRVLPGKSVRGLFYVPHRWRVLPAAEVGSAWPAEVV